jgi:hypothetical protein
MNPRKKLRPLFKTQGEALLSELSRIANQRGTILRRNSTLARSTKEQLITDQCIEQRYLAESTVPFKQRSSNDYSH